MFNTGEGIIMKRISRALPMVALASATFAVQPAMAQEAAAADQGGIEDIVVTAQRREQNLQDIPVAVTAVSLDSIKSYRVQSARDLSGLAPGLTISAPTGGNNSVNISLRGVTSTAFYPGQSSGVATYVDGIYIGGAGTNTEVPSIERVEI